MARISEYNLSFQEAQFFKPRSILNITENKTKRPPFFLPKMKLKGTSTEKEKSQLELEVRGLSGTTLTENKVFSKKGKRKRRNARKQSNKVNSLSSPGNTIMNHNTRGFCLPPIDSKSLTQNPMENTSRYLHETTAMPHREFELAFNTLMNVIERSKEQQKRTTERFQTKIVHGEQKPINEKSQSPEKPKTLCSPEWWLKLRRQDRSVGPSNLESCNRCLQNSFWSLFNKLSSAIHPFFVRWENRTTIGNCTLFATSPLRGKGYEVLTLVRGTLGKN